MSDVEEINDDNKIYIMEDEQRVVLGKAITQSILDFDKLFTKNELLKFLFKKIEEGKYDFNKEENDNPDQSLTEEEINAKKEKFFRQLKQAFDSINPEIFAKFGKRFNSATIDIMRAISSRLELTTNPIRKTKIKTVNQDTTEIKTQYETLNGIKPLIDETIYISSFFANELNSAYGFLTQNLDEFYNKKNNVDIIKSIEGVEKKARDDEFIQRVVNVKEKEGKKIISNNCNFIKECIKKNIDINNKMNNMIEQMNSIKEEQDMIKDYFNSEDNIFKDINEIEF